MSLRDFLYIEPHTLQEAGDCLREYGPRARKMAGGTDLLVRMKRREITVDVLVNLKRIPELACCGPENDTLLLGALTTVASLLRSEEIKRDFPAVHQAAATMASPQVRELATLGGNVCNASPAADLVPPLMAAGARTVVSGVSGQRTISLEKFFHSPGKTDLKSDEILTGLLLPRPGKGLRSTYLKHGVRRAHEIAIAGVAVSLRMAGGMRLEDVRIVLGAVGPTVFRATRAEEHLMRHPVSEEALAEAGKLASEAARPLSDIRANAWYRKEIVGVLTVRALKSCLFGR